MNTPMLSDISFHGGGGGGLAQNLFTVFIFILIGLILWGLGKFFFPKFNMPPKGMLIWDGLFILIAAIVVINFLAGVAGHAFISW
jgi:hypothetical protein